MANKLVAANGLLWNIQKLNTYLDQPDLTASGSGVAVSQAFTAPQTATFTFKAQSITMTDQTTAGSQGALKFCTFPAGNINILGATSDLAISRVGTALTATSAVVGAIGSVTVGTGDATLTSTEANIIPSTAATLAAGAGTMKGESTGAVTLDGTSTAVDLYLNFATPDTGSTGNDALLVTGTIRVFYINTGDN